jgi:hypothetical protein
MLNAYYYIAGSPLVYDSSNPRHTPGRLNYAAGPYDQKTCSTWWVHVAGHAEGCAAAAAAAAAEVVLP